LIHKIVLGLSDLDLADCLSSSTSQIDTFDDHDRTPLWWAAYREDVAKVKVLLKFKADVNKGNGSFPLHQAAGELNTELVELLLAAGAEVNTTNSQGSSSLLVACMRVTDDLSTLQALQRHHAEFECTNVFGRGPLATAAPQCNASCVNYLISCGASIYCGTGELPLAVAVRHGNLDATRAILQHRPLTDQTTDELLYVAGVAARRADIGILHILCDQIWPDDKVLKDETANFDKVELKFLGRSDRSAELDQAFDQLLTILRRTE